VQPRKCDCSPMCSLRAANPMRVRPVRTGGATFASQSAYLRFAPDHGDLAARAAGYAVLAHDPAVPAVAADYWMHSERFYQAALAPLKRDLDGDPAFERLRANPADATAERLLAERIGALLEQDPALARTLCRVVDAADDEVYINYFRGVDYRPDASPVGPERLERITEGRRHGRTGTGRDVLVVIPLSDRDGAGRIRNLTACLLALNDQTFPADRYCVTVVEFDDRPRWQSVIEPWVDRYLHLPGSGLFNKSWTLNAGVRATPGEFRTLCLLDADIIVDREFIERNHARFADPGHDAHLPHTEMLSLDAASSDRAIEERCGTGAPQAPLEGMRGLLLRDVPGACLWTRPEPFHRVGGFDERYRGWGGEDEDMLYRVAAAGAVTQFDDVFLHLAHRRPPMRTAEGKPFNAHVPLGTWTGRDGYGDLAGPVAVEDRTATGA